MPSLLQILKIRFLWLNLSKKITLYNGIYLSLFLTFYNIFYNQLARVNGLMGG